jgi:carbon-monoxide dehydrogenase medium subunit
VKPISPFKYHQPKTLEEALEYLNTLELAIPLAGGTDLIPTIREEVCQPDNLVDLNNITELNYIREEDDYIKIGATTTHSQLSTSQLIEEKGQALHDAVMSLGSPQIRNRGTLAGNLCNASPAADTAPPLLILNAEATITSNNDIRVIPLEDLFAGPKINSLEPNELVTEIRFPTPPSNSGSAFHRIGRRKAFTLSVVSSAAYLEMEQDIIADMRIAFGSVAITPLRLNQIEKEQKGKQLTDEVIEHLSETVINLVEPITDVRGTDEYRRDMCPVLMKRSLETARERIR